jgi:signal transduction histidine kinase
VSFRAKLLTVFTLTVVLSVGLVAWAVSFLMRDAFERVNAQRTDALVAQFQREFARRAEEVTRRVEGIANADETLHLAVSLSGEAPDLSSHVDDATGLAAAHQLDFLELIAADGTIISSAQWPARFGYKEVWVTQPAAPTDWVAQGAFLKREDLADGEALALMAVRVVQVSDHRLYIVGGRRLDREFLASLVLPEGMRALLYQETGQIPGQTAVQIPSQVSGQPQAPPPAQIPVPAPGQVSAQAPGQTSVQIPSQAPGQSSGQIPKMTRGALPSPVPPENKGAPDGRLVDKTGPFPWADKLLPLIARVERDPVETSAQINWTPDPATAEIFHVIPLTGLHKEVLGMFLVGSSIGELVELERHIRAVAMVVAAAGILLGLALSGWTAARVTKPVEQLAAAARQVAAGNWDVRVEAASKDELGQLARAFNQMTQQLTEQRDRLVQAERVAAWRELARRLAHELKNPLFPLQITVENLLRAREVDPGAFEEVFQESSRTLLAELANMKTIIGRFSDFAKMPAPQLQAVNINEVVRGALKIFEAQLHRDSGLGVRESGLGIGDSGGTAAVKILSGPGTPDAGPGVSGKPSINLQMNLDDTLKPIQADPDLLHRAVQNLILNALDAMPAGGTLTVQTQAAAGGVRVRISDTGKGLTKEECERLFTPYYTTKQHGTGLGLAIVQSVVSDHGGRISVESEPERGTTFRIDLPAAASSA